jgi:hypothetical protein
VHKTLTVPLTSPSVSLSLNELVSRINSHKNKRDQSPISRVGTLPRPLLISPHRSKEEPLATASPIERLNKVLPTPLGAYSIARLRSGKIGSSNISLGGILIARKSSKPMDLRATTGRSAVTSRELSPRDRKNAFQNAACAIKQHGFARRTVARIPRDTTREGQQFAFPVRCGCDTPIVVSCRQFSRWRIAQFPDPEVRAHDRIAHM